MPKRPVQPNDILKIHFVGDPQISPDGKRVLFSKKHINEKNKAITNLYTVDLEGDVRQWTQGEGGNGGGRWSPDGTKIAFVSGREKPSPQIYILPTDGGEAKKASSLPEGTVGAINWSPDGKYIAFLFREQHPDWTEKAKKEREEKGLSTPPRELDSVWYRLDGDGYFGPQRFGLYLLDVETGESNRIYDKCPMGFMSFDWSPDSKELAVTHTVNKNPWADAPNDQIFRLSLDGQSWQLDGLPKGEKGNVRWSPDGKHLAYIGDHSQDDPWGVRNNKLYVVNADGGIPTCISDQDDYCLSVMTLSDTKDAGSDVTLEWSPDSGKIYLSIGWHGSVQLGVVDLKKSRIELVTDGQHSHLLGNLSKDGKKFAALWGDALHINEVGVIYLKDKNTSVLTHFNREYLEEVKLSVPEEVWLESPDGTMVHTWVMKPIDYLEPKRYPAVLEIHGGPHTQYGWTFFHEFQVLAAAGYVVVFSNPRGSKGYGEAHCAAIRGDWGNKDWIDVQTVMRWMQHQPYIHPGQMGVMGGSYGGYMTNWVVGHTKDFKAAITDRCVSNLVSMGGNSDFPINRDGYWAGSPWGDLDKIATLWKQSPIAYFDQVETPMLIIHSEGDLRCNIEQGEEVFTALQVRGIESRFVRYPSSTSHGMSRSGPADLRQHRLNEILAWWEKHLK